MKSKNDKLPHGLGWNLGRLDWMASKLSPVIGIDEVGRGCLAGPVVAGAVILKGPQDDAVLVDSKSISEAKRKKVSDLIHANHFVGIGSACAQEVDELNILQASFLAMIRALQELKKVAPKGALVLVDGHLKIPDWTETPQLPLIKGDQVAAPISAASIVAKVFRDELMVSLDQEFPDYGWKKNKGYGSAFHRGALQRLGATPYHRRSFAGVVADSCP